jgi:hypothetical protein
MRNLPFVRRQKTQMHKREKSMQREIRRVVTSNQADGNVVVLFEGHSPNIHRTTGKWREIIAVTVSTPADVTRTAGQAPIARSAFRRPTADRQS